ncbi:glycosyl hydrolase family 18 protein [Pelotomaculum isophthalicicum JI]|uniref:Glycosyl hydrolase family 18 protein n=1 Tax=Pelotomaculum isophthalicicum JI TaxID=947010 RepID=A0A9X4H109_9FIRM|nr:glycosyl hydrolase family 18 protein [Pelotomaculum isophthalicicum]MDF9407680.1 glycosyl hydrolase family 18 protein [Pelotomaculum isophthalicicum JI]
MSKNISKYPVLVLLGLLVIVLCSASSEAFSSKRSDSHRIFLQYLQAYGPDSYSDYRKQLSLVTDSTNGITAVSPNWYHLNNSADGTFTGPWELSSGNYNQLVAVAHHRGFEVLPLIAADWDDTGKMTLYNVLSQKTSRLNLVNQIVGMITSSGADGVVIDFEYMSGSTGPFLTQFMLELSSELHARDKLLVEAVPSRTSTSRSYTAFDYQSLSLAVDYLAIMTYDYSTSEPGPIAPPDWIKRVLDYARAQHVAMDKVLLGLPYYGRDWASTGSTYEAHALGLAQALSRSAEYSASIERETTQADLVGIPHYSYQDESGTQHFVYYDDYDSWRAKLGFLDEYNLGGVHCWSVMWLNDNTARSLFSLLRELS